MAYLAIATRMGAANALGEEVTTARNILRSAVIIPHPVQNYDPVGISAPYPMVGGPVALPEFFTMLASTINAAAAATLRARPGVADPGAFTGAAPGGLRRGVMGAEFRPDERLAILAALREKDPDRWAKLPDGERAATLAWLACREAAGHGGDPLPKVVTERFATTDEPAVYAPTDSARFRLFSDSHGPSRGR